MNEPLTPPDCDLRGMQFMPLDAVRLLDSDLFALSTGDEFKAAVALWCKSWGQVPAASLPNDDRILAHLSGVKQWKKVKGMALRGWILCADDRWYHPVVAAKALEAMDRREDWQESNENRKTRQQRWRERCKALADQLRDLGVTPPRGASLETLESLLVDAQASTQASTQRDGVDNVEIGKTGTGTGTVLKEKESLSPPPLQGTPAGGPASTAESDSNASPYGLLCKALRQAGVQVQPGNPDLRSWVDAGLTVDEAMAAVDIARTTKPAPTPIAWAYLTKVLETQRQRATAAKPAAGAPSDPMAWAATWSGIVAKGAELGIEQQPGEIAPDFKARVHAAAGLTAADKSRLLADYGVRA